MEAADGLLHRPTFRSADVKIQPDTRRQKVNLDKLFARVAGIVMAFALAGHLNTLQFWIWKAQARVLYESRTTTWGSPRFFKKETHLRNDLNHRAKSPHVTSPDTTSGGVICKKK